MHVVMGGCIVGNQVPASLLRNRREEDHANAKAEHDAADHEDGKWVAKQ